jgi:hypothetical protein
LATVQSNFKAKITDKTVFKDKETGKAISLADLMVGDMVQVSSAKGGNKLDAVEVVRLPKPLGPRK